MSADIRTARLFMAGRHQAVWLPEGVRLEGTLVEIHREGEALVLQPVAQGGGEARPRASRKPPAGAARGAGGSNGGGGGQERDDGPGGTAVGDPGPQQEDLFS